MGLEENVDVETTLTEEIASAKTPLEGREEASAVLGKFKDVDALARAYEALQAEFTRRSQRLRALERERENFEGDGAPSGAEKLRKTAKARRAAAKAFDEFVAKTVGENGGEATGAEVAASARTEPVYSAEKATDSLPQEAGTGAVEKEKESRLGGAEKAADGVKEGSKEHREEGKAELDSETLFQRANDDEGVRLRIVGEYLSSLGRAGAPITGGGRGVLATAPVKAKTVGQAGDMALQYFRKPTLE